MRQSGFYIRIKNWRGIIRNMETKQVGNLLTFIEGKDTLYVEWIARGLVRVTRDESHKSRILDLSSFEPTSFSVAEDAEGTLIKGGLLSLKVKDGLLIEASSASKILLEETKDSKEEASEDLSLMAKEGHEVNSSIDRGISHQFILHEDEHFYGLGDHTGPIDLRGYKKECWNSDNPAAQVDTFLSMYKSFPFFIIRKGNDYLGLYLDNTFKTTFDFGLDEKTFSFSFKEGPDDFYLFYGPTLKELLAAFTKATGRMSLPPRWSLGYGQCRWSYHNEAELESVIEGYKKADIPVTTLYLDIDYMDGYRVFTTSEKSFPHFASYLASLHSRGYKVITIIDPGVKEDKGYSIYDEGMKNGYFATYKGKTYVNEVWPGRSVYPSFNNADVRKWWGDNVGLLSSQGVDGVWCDMNEPASFREPLPDDVLFGKEEHKEIHNVYGYYMAEATYEGLKGHTAKRPFVITRACFTGASKFTSVWTGDNQSIYDHLRLAIPQQLSLGLSGMPFVGTDIGGFGGDTTKELLCRWIELGAFSPLFRNHSAAGTKRQEPYYFDKETIDIYRKWVNFRYQLTPYMYDLFYNHLSTGLPPLRPLFMEFPDDASIANLNTEFMLGPSILVSPVLSSGENNVLLKLPQGRWINFFDMSESKNGGIYALDASLSECPVYIRSGSIIPLFEKGYTNIDKTPDTLTLLLFPGEGSYIHYEDAGDGYGYIKGEYNLYEFTNHDGSLTYRLLHEGYRRYKKIIARSLSGETTLLP